MPSLQAAAPGAAVDRHPATGGSQALNRSISNGAASHSHINDWEAVHTTRTLRPVPLSEHCISWHTWWNLPESTAQSC